METVVSAVRLAAERVRTALDYVREHKGRVSAVSAVVVGLVAHFVPSLPADDILRTIASLLSAV